MEKLETLTLPVNWDKDIHWKYLNKLPKAGYFMEISFREYTQIHQYLSKVAWDRKSGAFWTKESKNNGSGFRIGFYREDYKLGTYWWRLVMIKTAIGNEYRLISNKKSYRVTLWDKIKMIINEVIPLHKQRSVEYFESRKRNHPRKSKYTDSLDKKKS